MELSEADIDLVLPKSTAKEATTSKLNYSICFFCPVFLKEVHA